MRRDLRWRRCGSGILSSCARRHNWIPCVGERPVVRVVIRLKRRRVRCIRSRSHISRHDPRDVALWHLWLRMWLRNRFHNARNRKSLGVSVILLLIQLVVVKEVRGGWCRRQAVLLVYCIRRTLLCLWCGVSRCRWKLLVLRLVLLLMCPHAHSRRHCSTRSVRVHWKGQRLHRKRLHRRVVCGVSGIERPKLRIEFCCLHWTCWTCWTWAWEQRRVVHRGIWRRQVHKIGSAVVRMRNTRSGYPESCGGVETESATRGRERPGRECTISVVK